MCYPCTHCNRCGRIVEFGTCRGCGFVNEPGATECVKCGLKFPPPPGGSSKKEQTEQLESSDQE